MKATMRYHFILFRVVFIIKSTNNKVRMCWKGSIYTFWWECKLVKPLWKTIEFPQKLKMEWPYDTEISFLGIDPKGMKSAFWRDICKLMFITALFTRAKIWEQPKCPSMDERIQKRCVIYTNRILFIHEQKGYPATGKNRDGTWCSTNRDRLGRERQVLYDITYKQNLKLSNLNIWTEECR